MGKVIKNIQAFVESVDPDGEIVETPRSAEHFDDNGNKIREVSYDMTGAEESSTTWEFNEAAQLIRRIESSYGEMMEDVLISYQDAKQSLQEITYGQGGKTLAEFIYGEGSLIIQKKDEDGELEEKESYLFKDDLILQKEVYDEDGTLASSLKNKFSDEGKVLERIEFDVNDGFEMRKNFEYNDAGSLVAVVSFRAKKKIGSASLEYDGKGNRISEIHNDSTQIKTEYDDENRVLKNEVWNMQQNMVERYSKFTYEEDRVIEEEFYDYQKSMEVVKYKYEFY
ncbi:MAG: YD repeat-containing protein [Limisphaerales bacterium]|jgi:YD repeat-containing protein